ncbi:hypothetical protein RCL1_001587 [Eukaryota sp. TZLM3-RCL]
MTDSLQRLLLEVSTDRDVWEAERTYFSNQITDWYKLTLVQGVSLISLKPKQLARILDEGVEVMFLGKRRCVLDFQFFDSVLRFIHSSLVLVGRTLAEFPRFHLFVLGVGKREDQCCQILTEVERSPCLAMNCAYLPSSYTLAIRHLALETFFFRNFLPLVDCEVQLEKSQSGQELLKAVKFSVMKQCINLINYPVRGDMDLLQKFIEVSSNVYFHHALSLGDLLQGKAGFSSEEIQMFNTVTQIYQLPHLHALFVLISDLALLSKNEGPIWLCLEAHRSGNDQLALASLLFYIASLFDLHDDYRSYTGIVYWSLFLRVIHNKQLDYSSLTKMLQCDPLSLQYDIVGRDLTITERLLKLFKHVLSKITSTLLSCEFVYQGVKDTATIVNELKHLFSANNVEFNTEKITRAVLSLPKSNTTATELPEILKLIDNECYQSIKILLLDIDEQHENYHLIEWLSVQYSLETLTSTAGIFD